MLGICPDISLVDISHDIPAHDIRTGSLVLKSAYPFFPKKTIHLGVVDPGVGGGRRGVILEDKEGNQFVGPDNGLFSFALEQEGVRVFEVNNQEWILAEPSSTFHGRDIFAPVVARLASGNLPSEAGPEISDAVIHPLPVPFWEVDEKERYVQIYGIVLHVDRFGNLITNIDRNFFAKASENRKILSAHLILGNRKVADLIGYYGEVDDLSSGALFNSWGLLEVFVPSGNASRDLNAKMDDHVTVRIFSERT
jgi:S-adenosylmethionine hydrolase